jgi:hypothetical protein
MPDTTNARIVVEPNSNVIRVYVTGETLYNLEATQQLTRRALGLGGCLPCCSGRVVLFNQEEGEFNV